MHLHSIILAKGDDALIKIAFWVVIGVIWVISSIVSSIKKKMQEMPKPQDISDVPIELTPTMEVRSAQEMRSSQMRPPQRRVPQMPGVRIGQPMFPTRAAPLRPVPLGPPPLKQKGKLPKRRSAAQVAPVAPPQLYKQNIATPDQPPALGALQPVSTAPKAARESTASQLARALQRPGALRTQIVIAEIFGKPLALRETDRVHSM
jgi:hypothetical protein